MDRCALFSEDFDKGFSLFVAESLCYGSIIMVQTRVRNQFLSE